MRQNLYKELKQQGRLSASDDKPLGYNQYCLGKWFDVYCTFYAPRSGDTDLLLPPTTLPLVGVSEPMDPEQYPMLKNDFADFDVVIPKEEPFYVSL